MTNYDSLQALRIDLAQKSKWNIGFYWSGFFYWIFVLTVGVAVPLDTAKYVWLIGGFFIVPVAILLSRFLGTEAFPKANTLADLAGQTHATVNVLGFPVILVPLIFYPEAQILMMAIMYCIDFYVFTWVFGSRLFLVAASIRVVGASAIWFFLPEVRLTLLPAFVALTYLGLMVAIPHQRKKWEIIQNVQAEHNKRLQSDAQART